MYRHNIVISYIIGGLSQCDVNHAIKHDIHLLLMSIRDRTEWTILMTRSLG